MVKYIFLGLLLVAVIVYWIGLFRFFSKEKKDNEE